MDKEQLNNIISEKLKLIRTEQGYTQDKMAEVIGMSKKTLVQIEKGRTAAGWMTTVAVCALFRESQILQSTLGSSDPVEIAEMAAHSYIRRSQDKTLGGRIWWREANKWKGYRLQQNVISGHYRIIDPDDYRLFSTYDQQAAEEEWYSLIPIKEEGHSE